MIKTFKGILADDAQDRIRLSTIKGKVGYRIVKFQISTTQPFDASIEEHVVKIYNESQSTINGVVNFTDSNLLGVAVVSNNTAGYQYPISTQPVIFDREIFNQDIFVTHSDVLYATACNYYIELEVIPLDDAGAEYTTLKDMRQS